MYLEIIKDNGKYVDFGVIRVVRKLCVCYECYLLLKNNKSIKIYFKVI